MKQIKNIVFDFGGVIISFDREQAVKAFERIGVREADRDVYKRQDMCTLTRQRLK